MPKTMLTIIFLTSLCFLSPLAWAEPIWTCTYSSTSDNPPESCLQTDEYYYVLADPIPPGENASDDQYGEMTVTFNGWQLVETSDRFYGQTFPTGRSFSFYESDGTTLSDTGFFNPDSLVFQTITNEGQGTCSTDDCVTETYENGGSKSYTVLLQEIPRADTPLANTPREMLLTIGFASDGDGGSFFPLPGVPDVSDYISIKVVPEPGSVALFGIGTAGLIGYGWIKRSLKR